MKMKKILAAAALTFLLSALTACGQSAAKPSEAPESEHAATQDSQDTTAGDPEEQPAEDSQTEQNTAENTASDGTLSGPYIVTSCGQSPGAVMVNMVAMQAGLTSANDNGLTADSLNTEDYKTLIVTTGTSMKGMGAAGTDVNAEIERCVELINKAKEAGLTVAGAHVEGMARRTDSSDTASIEAVMGLADIILVIEESDSDGYFTKYSEDNQKPLIKVKDSLAISSVLK